jgi:pyrimidine-nucleoside phosphorylase
MNIKDIIEKKNNNQELTHDELAYAINNYVNNNISDNDMTLLLQAILKNGMTYEETSNMTEIMLNSGDKLDLSDIKDIKVDKHSTGGVGDKTTLVVAPLVASCGVKVAKMSGRSLGYTGGTIDKLESIHGFRTNLTLEEFKKQINDIGVAISGATLNFVPADKKIYALRDVTNTVSSIPLIASSIMSKKLASGADKIVIDVKVGSGALLHSLKEARELARYMVEIGKAHHKEVVCLLTNMDEPLGKAIGNELEVIEAIDTLNGKGPGDFTDLVLSLSATMVSLGLNISLTDAEIMVKTNLYNGKAYDKFAELVHAQGGRLYFHNNAKTMRINSLKAGYLTRIETKNLGECARELGAGRLNKDDIINSNVGFIINKKVGDYVEQGDELLTIYYDDKDIALSSILDCFIIEEKYVKPKPLIYEVIK